MVQSPLTFVAAVGLVQPAARWALHWSSEKPFGLVHLTVLPAWAEFGLSFLLMDLAFYYWHLANHRVPFLWRFHNVHHIDPDLDVSTGFRFHFGEVAMSAAFRVVQVSLIGLSVWAFAVYELVFQANTLFHHSNLRLPIRFERLLNKLLVTPRMHGIHHSQVQRENNSNYGVVFPWWDRLHRTLGLNIPQVEVVIGIAGYSEPNDNDLRNALLPLGAHGQVLDLLREAQSFAESLNDQRRVGWLSAYMSMNLCFMANYERAVEAGKRALAIADALDDRALRVATSFYLGVIHYAKGDYRRAIDFENRCAGSVQPDELRERFGLAGPAAAFAAIFVVACLAELGQFTEGIARATELIRTGEAIDQPYSLTFAYFNVGLLYLRKGEPATALPLLERARAVTPAFTLPWVTHYLGHAYLLLGRTAEALPLLKQAVEQAPTMNLMWAQALRVATLAEAHQVVGQSDAAVELARRALELARDHKERGHEAWVLRLLGELAVPEEPREVEKSADYYRRAMALADELGMRPLLAHCHLGLGKLYRRAGKRQEAQQHLTTATTLYREMDMGFWLEQADAESKELEH